MATGERAQRANGSALKTAINILESGTQFSKVLYFVGGPCTIGLGQVVGISYNENIRSYLDITKENDSIKYMPKAKKFFTEVTQRAIKANITVDIFAFSLD
jgi:protein transport protein SEC23